MVKSGKSFDFNSKDYSRGPLFLAARGGHEAVVRLLIERYGVNITSKTKGGEPRLKYAEPKF